MTNCTERIIMNIALVNVVGEEGSTGKLVKNHAAFFTSKGHICKIFHGRGARIDDGLFVKHGCRMDTVVHYGLAKLTGKEGYYSTLFTKRILKDLKDFAPQWIITLNLHGHWLNIPLFLTEISKMDSYISIHMPDEFPYTARCEYTNGCDRFMNQCIGCERYKNIAKQYRDKKACYEKILPKACFTSAEYIVSKARQSSLLKDAKFNIINPGIDVDYYHPVDADRIKKELNISNDKIVLLDVAPYSNKRKGVELFLQAAKKLEGNDKYVFVNVGFDGDNGIIPSNYVAIPYVSDQEKLREIYSMADCFMCTSMQDALPNACAEAMSCGTPIIAFNVSGMPFLADYPVLKLINDISVDKLVEAIINIEKKDSELSRKSRDQAVERYAFSKNEKKTLNEYYDVLSGD